MLSLRSIANAVANPVSTNPWPTPARIGLIVAGEAVITRRLKLTSQFQSWTHYAHYAP
jgi:hypothetical protein